jgi:hypothetical protein
VKRLYTRPAGWAGKTGAIPMKSITRGSIACLAGVITMASYAQWQEPTDTIPAFYQKPPSNARSIFRASQLSGEHSKESYQITTYREAEELASFLYQLPCYCRCDRHEGHKSLHSCFETAHGSGCRTCMKEVAFAFEMKKMGKSAHEVRSEIEKGEWQTISLETQQYK